MTVTLPRWLGLLACNFWSAHHYPAAPTRCYLGADGHHLPRGSVLEERDCRRCGLTTRTLLPAAEAE